MSILVIYAGGTIGMQPGVAGLAPVPGALTGRLKQLLPESDLLEYDPLLDSSAMGPAHWNRIAGDIAERADDYEGFLVLHGTDTLAWTASALALLLRGLNKPVILTGAMRPWFESDSDAPCNVAAALALLDNACGFAEVGVVMAGRLWRGCRVRKVDCDHDDAFAAPNEAPLGVFDDGRWHLEVARFRRTDQALHFEPFDTAVRVLHLQLAPGFTTGWLASALRQGPPHALLLQSFGSGNLPSDPALLAVLGELAARIPVVSLSICPRGRARPGLYAASLQSGGGLLDGGEMTPEAALAKLYLVLGYGHAKRAGAFLDDCVGERGEADSPVRPAVV
ncbi:asparaginase [Jeongeupia chitinilytica]|uniref:L-asparaginase 1 n=1 Tax=Jeongeupia chitinilytica TaxID=1041641 RepID=A0ABQ3GZY6_9NEIS|nr:asparaginase [Jeongeupia chitinilytica]GHD63516.1 L-asparaginase 1 [Jeongeupia chitinilytica]